MKYQSKKSFTLVELMTPNNQPKVGVGLPAGKAGASSNSKQSFTLVELMIVIAILAILSAIVIFALNPSRLFDNFRDTRRVSDINTLSKAINFIETWNTNGISYGSTTTVYISLPDTSSTCSTYSLPTLPTGYTYSCKTTANYRKVDGTGWIPIDFSINTNNSYLSVLPIDPVNDTTYFYTYYSGGSYEVTALLKNPNTNSINDDDSLTGAFTMGSPNRTWTTPLSRDTNLVGHWKFDEGSGDALDYSGHGYTGTLHGPERVVTTGTNQAMYYDANGADYISTPSFAIPNTGILTIEAWMKSKINANTYQFIFGENSQDTNIGYIGIDRFQNTDTMYYGYADGTPYDYISFVNLFQNLDNQWIHIVTVCDYNNKTIKAYRNGIQFSTTRTLSGTPAFPSTNRVKYIGAYNTTQYKLTDGSLDEVRIYNRGLSEDEVMAIYNQTKSNYE